jgi:hypothetical protein
MKRSTWIAIAVAYLLDKIVAAWRFVFGVKR